MMKQIAYNYSVRTEKIKYIVIHDTGNTSKGANAEAHFNYFNGGDRGASADFFIDDTQALQVNDYTKYYSWHCGDGAGKNGITNRNSIGLELCINSDGNYDKAFNLLVELTKRLMKELNIKADNVVRHFDASGKNCPKSMNNGTWEIWNKFKRKLSEEVNNVEKVYNYTIEVPEWGRMVVQKLLDKGYLKGDEKGELGINDTMLKIFIIMDRAGLI